MKHAFDIDWMKSCLLVSLDDGYLFLMGYLKSQIYELKILARDHFTYEICKMCDVFDNKLVCGTLCRVQTLRSRNTL
jgi:hypothetical protein